MLLKKFLIDFYLAIILTIVATIAILCIPAVDAHKNIMYIIAFTFWLSLILGQFFFWKCNHERKRIEMKGTRMRENKKKQLGITAFFRNFEAFIADIILFLSAGLVAVLTVFQIKTSWLIILGASMLYLSFNMHCILNGKNYRFIKLYKKSKTQKKEQEEHE